MTGAVGERPGRSPTGAGTRLGEIVLTAVTAASRLGRCRYRATRDRVTALRAVLDEAGLTLTGGNPLFGEWSQRWGRQAGRWQHPLPTNEHQHERSGISGDMP